jgi:fructose-bisphosphate aldolase, class I
VTIDPHLTATAGALVGAGKGILAADESVATITKRFTAAGIASTSETRRDYRELLVATPGLAEHISGVILHDETIRQVAADGTAFPALLAALGILTGVKVDTGAKRLAGAPGEQVTEGLDGLQERLAAYRGLGASFAKWRAVITIGDGTPTACCLGANAHALARYAGLCQEGGMVPIVEPEVIMDGDHSIERCQEVTEATLRAVFAALADQRVELEAMVLKASMVISGKSCPFQAGVAEVAQATLACLRRTVPPAVPGVAFLSGGQGPEQATVHLNAMNRIRPHPWQLSFSYGRALQDPALAAWHGEPANVAAAQQALARLAEANGAATSGAYRPELEPQRV